MPTYDYECDACGENWELFQRITADPIKKCPKCGKNKARRLFGTGAAIMFKGSGFYETDYRSDSYKKGAESEKKSSESKSDKSETSKTGTADTVAKADSTTTNKSESNAKPETTAAPKKKKAD